MATSPASDRVPPGGIDSGRPATGAEAAPRSPLDFVFRLPGAQRIAARLGPAELRRRLLHMSPGLLLLVMWIHPHSYPDWELPIRAWAIGLAIGLVFFSLQQVRDVARTGETGWADSVLWYSFSIVAALAIFPRHPEYCLIVLVILAFGDGSATLGGKLLGGPQLFWNRDKSWAGLLCFWVCGTIFAALAYWGEVIPQPAFNDSLRIAAVVTAAAALAESLPLKVNDNLRVGLVSLVACETVIGGNPHALRMLVVYSALFWLVAYWRRRRAAGV